MTGVQTCALPIYIYIRGVFGLFFVNGEYEVQMAAGPSAVEIGRASCRERV